MKSWIRSIKSVVKPFVPKSVLRVLNNNRLKRDMSKSAGKTRQEIFSEIYRNNLWGGEAGTYLSGAGSRNDVIESYVKLVRSLIAAERVTAVVDLGCGDFSVGRRIVSPEIDYIGCDVFPDIVQRNTANFAGGKVNFQAVDIVADSLPDGDLCIIRQVFQHLSNGDISVVLKKARKYRLVLITDEQFRGDGAERNADILPYHGTRRAFGQGLKLDRAPFSEKIEIRLEHSAGSDYGAVSNTYLRTVLIRNDPLVRDSR